MEEWWVRWPSQTSEVFLFSYLPWTVKRNFPTIGMWCLCFSVFSGRIVLICYFKRFSTILTSFLIFAAGAPSISTMLVYHSIEITVWVKSGTVDDVRAFGSAFSYCCPLQRLSIYYYFLYYTLCFPLLSVRIWKRYSFFMAQLRRYIIGDGLRFFPSFAIFCRRYCFIQLGCCDGLADPTKD